MGVSVECYFPRAYGERASAIQEALNAALSPSAEVAWSWEVPATRETVAEGTCTLTGPSGLLWITPHIPTTQLSVRWRWFLQNAEARRETLEQLWAMGHVLSAHSMLILPDWASETLLERPDSTFEQVVSRLLSEWGPCEPSVDTMRPEVVAETENSSPQVWFHVTKSFGGA